MKYVFITGTSSGIGFESVQTLVDRGYHVFATLRKESDIQRLNYHESENVTPLLMDVRNKQSVSFAVRKVSEITGGQLDVLINNAAVATGEPLEIVDIDNLRDEFEVNVFGLVEVIQQFLPLLKKAKGRIINISSNNGYISMPYMGGYSATKFALEAISDALRMELDKWEIPVVVINPDKVATSMWDTSIDNTLKQFSSIDENKRKDYQKEFSSFIEAIKRISKKSLAPKVVVEDIVKSIESNHPKMRYLPGFENKVTYLLFRVLPKKTLNNLIKKEFKLTN